LFFDIILPTLLRETTDCDFEENSWPILKQLDIPVTLFVPTAYPADSHRQLWWDQLHNALRNADKTIVNTPIGTFPLDTVILRRQAYEQLRDYAKELPHHQAMVWIASFCEEIGIPSLPKNYVLNWGALKKLAHEGVTLAAHTSIHPLMNRIDAEEARAEALQSWTDLKREIGDTPPVFAYPGGGFSDDVVQVLKEGGFQLAFTTDRGINNLQEANPLLLKRINVGFSKPLAMIQMQLLSSLRI
jgi:peptidoglycan/xylan/chitin deacetylase (PgdA/CDA1 family)